MHFICFAGLKNGLSDYYLIPIFLYSLLGTVLHRYLLSFLPFQVHSLASGKTCSRQIALLLLLFYAFKTLCFYSRRPVCKPDFLIFLDTFFIACTKIIRQIKRLI